MPLLDNYLDRTIGEDITRRDQEERANHKSSGKLSASSLGLPLQWQLLKVLGIPQPDKDEYALRKFERGRHVEDWLLSRIPCLEKQKFVEYRNVVGYVDAIVDTAKWDIKGFILPLEVKSVSNAKYKRIVKQGADRGHKLQAALYALALNSSQFAIAYVATDDYRVRTYIYDTEAIREEVDRIITRFDEHLAKRLVPPFQAEESWQESPKYNNYPEWATLTQEEIELKLTSMLPGWASKVAETKNVETK